MRFTLTALSLLLLAGLASAQESYSAKSLFFGEDESVVAVSTSKKDAPTALAVDQEATKKAAPKVAASKKSSSKNIGASYFIRLKNADGSTQNVLASRKFKSGERFQLGVKVNRPSYVYIFNEDPNGKVSQVYPRPGSDNFIDAMGVVFLPSQGAFEFDQEAGVEQLLVYVSAKPIAAGAVERVRTMRPDVVTGSAPVVASASCERPVVAAAPAPAAPGMLIASAGDYAAKGIALSDDAGCAKDAAKGASYAAKGIAFTDDSDTGGTQAASYVVKKTTSTDASLFLKVKLDHQ